MLHGVFVGICARLTDSSGHTQVFQGEDDEPLQASSTSIRLKSAIIMVQCVVWRAFVKTKGANS
jgi:hypothetical protein